MRKKTLITLFLFALAVFMLFYTPKKKAQYQHRDGFIFGTVYSVTYSNPENQDLSLQINSALEAVNASLSMFNPESTISKVNNNQPVELDLLFLTVWKTGQYVSDCTHGAFDMTVAPLVDLWGFGLKNRDVVTDAEVDSVREYVGYELVVLEDGVIHKAYPEMRIDAGAIAKGYACDVVADTLEAYGCTDFCIEIGGELVVKGLNSKGVNWHIAINKPVEDSLCVNREIQEIVELTDCGMATSGNYRNFYEVDGKKYNDAEISKLCTSKDEQTRLKAGYETNKVTKENAHWISYCYNMIMKDKVEAKDKEQASKLTQELMDKIVELREEKVK